MKTQPEHNTKETGHANLGLFQSIDDEKDWDLLKARIAFNKKRSVPTWWRAAAIFILLLGLGALAGKFFFNQEQMLVVQSGESTREIRLPDGTSLTLNKYSSLSYPEKFDRRHRTVIMEGEGYFEVAPDPDRTFRIDVAGLAGVEALGTKFNIFSFLEKGMVRVQMVEGKVAFYPAGKPDMRAVLEGNDQALMQDGSVSKNTGIDRNFLTWKTGVIHFEQEGIQEVARILKAFYNCEIDLDSSVDRELTYTSVLDNQELVSVLKEMSLVLGISYTLDENKVDLYMTE